MHMKRIMMCLVIGAFVGYIASCCIVLWLCPNMKFYEEVVATYFELMASVLTAVGTVGAVVVSLFRMELMRLLYPDKCSVGLIGDNNFVEKLDENETSPRVKYYAGSMLISNASKREIEGFQIIIKEASYASKTDIKRKKNLRVLNNGVMYWGDSRITETTIQSQGECSMPLFRIHPEADMASPDGTNSSKLSLRIMGVKDVDASIPQCVWTVRYQLRSRRGIVKTVELQIDWDGVWCSRKTEMKNSLTVTMECIC